MTLTESEAALLKELEQTIDAGLRSYIQVGMSLIQIRDGRLYRVTHKTFEAYCEEKWKLKRTRAYEIMSAASVADRVRAVSHIQPRESHAAELAALPQGKQKAAWKAAVGNTRGRPTAAAVRRVVSESLPDGWEERLEAIRQVKQSGDKLCFYADELLKFIEENEIDCDSELSRRLHVLNSSLNRLFAALN